MSTKRTCFRQRKQSGTLPELDRTTVARGGPGISQGRWKDAKSTSQRPRHLVRKAPEPIPRLDYNHHNARRGASAVSAL
jgi:hypothetical protein